MSFFTLSIVSYGHDASIAVFDNDELIFFVACERFAREKYTSEVPLKIIDKIYNDVTNRIDLFISDFSTKHGTICRNYVSKKFKDSNYIQVVNPTNNSSYAKKVFDNFLQIDNFDNITHHCTHAISSFYLSPFEEAVCLVVDAFGAGTFVKTDTNDFINLHAIQTTSIIEMKKDYNRRNLYNRFYLVPESKYTMIPFLPDYDIPDIPSSFSTHLDIGAMYDTITKRLFGKFCYAGKTMGLSAYGNSENNLPSFLIKDTILSDKNVFTEGRSLNKVLYPEFYEDPLDFQMKANLAYEVQKSLEKIFLHHAEFIKKNSKIKNLIISGGCALNILGVSLIKEKFPEFNIYVDPIANDATHSIGLGIHFYNYIKCKKTLLKKCKFNSIYIGPKYNESKMVEEIDSFLLNMNLNQNFVK